MLYGYSLSDELDDLPTEQIRHTVKAIRGANEIGAQMFGPAYATQLLWHGEVADALDAYCARRDTPRCEAIVCHGPGHQTRTRCEVRGEHDTHFVSDLPDYGSFEWSDPEHML